MKENKRAKFIDPRKKKNFGQLKMKRIYKEIQSKLYVPESNSSIIFHPPNSQEIDNPIGYRNISRTSFPFPSRKLYPVKSVNLSDRAPCYFKWTYKISLELRYIKIKSLSERLLILLATVTSARECTFLPSFPHASTFILVSLFIFASFLLILIATISSIIDFLYYFNSKLQQL